MWVQSLGWEDPLEEEMPTCSSIIDWEIWWREEAPVYSLEATVSSRLQSMGLQRVKTWLSMHTQIYTHTPCTIQRNNWEKSKDLRKSAMEIYEDPSGVYAEFVRHLFHRRIWKNAHIFHPAFQQGKVITLYIFNKQQIIYNMQSSAGDSAQATL